MSTVLFSFFIILRGEQTNISLRLVARLVNRFSSAKTANSGVQNSSPNRTDLCYLAGQAPAGLLCELVNPDDDEGNMARRDDCWRFAKNWGLKCISVEDLARYVLEEGKGKVPEA